LTQPEWIKERNFRKERGLREMGDHFCGCLSAKSRVVNIGGGFSGALLEGSKLAQVVTQIEDRSKKRKTAGRPRREGYWGKRLHPQVV